jgi:hypothetical protein
MKITVERELSTENELVFTIRCQDARLVNFNEQDISLLNILDKSKLEIEVQPVSNEQLKETIVNYIHAAKEKVFNRIRESLTFQIENESRPKFVHMATEIYNWVYDSQEKPLKDWFQTFDPQRTKYYFDNDQRFDSDEYAGFTEL